MQNHIVENGPKTSAFGEALVVIPFPTIQIDPVYGIRLKTDLKVLTDTASAGALTLNTNSNGAKEFKISSGVGANSYCIMQSQRTVRYRPGQGMRFQYTARFTQGVAGNTQRAGAYNYGNELAFGYNGTSFGILFRTGGLAEIRTLTVTVGAGGAENATVTLNGVTKVVAVTAGSATLVAATLAAASYPGWEVTSNGTAVIFVAQNDTTFSGAFTLTSTGTTAGTFALTSAGLTSTSTWIPQSSWNVDHCDGSGASGFTLNPTKGNVFEIKSQYLGYGQVYFSIENEVGRLILVHKVNYPNSNVTPIYSVPNFKAGYTSRNTTNTTSISLYGASYSAFIDGHLTIQRNYDSRSASKSNVGTSSTPILSIRNRNSFNNTWNLTSVELHSVKAAIDGAKPGILEVIIGATLTGAVWTYHDQTNSIVEYDTSATALSLGSNAQILRSLPLAKSDSGRVDFAALTQVLEGADILTIALKASSTTIDGSVSVSWHED